MNIQKTNTSELQDFHNTIQKGMELLNHIEQEIETTQERLIKEQQQLRKMMLQGEISLDLLAEKCNMPSKIFENFLQVFTNSSKESYFSGQEIDRIKKALKELKLDTESVFS